MAASDIASAPIVCARWYASPTSSKSQAGAVRIGWSSAGKCAEPPRTSGVPVSAIDFAIDE